MELGLLAVLFGYGALVVFALNLAFASRNADAICLSLMMLAMWALANFFVNLAPRPDSMGPLSLLDLAGGLAAWLAWRTKKARWKWLLVRAFLVALGVHVLFWTYYRAIPTWLPDLAIWMGEDMSPDGRKLARNTYVLGYNVTTALQLLCIAWPGGSHGLVVLGGWLFRRSGGRDPVGSSS